jgi:16S rRNA (adenine1518-N6/adenine1519-N6)-dimethyltransferase
VIETLPPLRDVIERHGLAARKSLGQHFLLDLNLTGRIARSAGDLTEGTVIEVGPGPGGLTRALLAAGCGHLVVIERDARCVPVLDEIAAACPGRMDIVMADALEIDIAGLGQAPRRIVANLPYNVGTALLLRWLRQAQAIHSMVLMFQKEVVDRLAARPGSSDYGRLSVIVQWLCVVDPLFNVDRRAFTPPPAVESTVVRITPRATPLLSCPMATLERVTAAAFGQRRKMLRSSLKSLGGSEELIEMAGLSPTMRAEEVDVLGFCRIANALESRGAEVP